MLCTSLTRPTYNDKHRPAYVFYYYMYYTGNCYWLMNNTYSFTLYIHILGNILVIEFSHAKLSATWCSWYTNLHWGTMRFIARYCIDVKIYRWSCSIKIHHLKKDKHGMVWSTTDLGLQNASMFSFVYSKTNYSIKHQMFISLFLSYKNQTNNYWVQGNIIYALQALALSNECDWFKNCIRKKKI